MTEVQKVNQEATIDARDNFEAIDEKLENLKKKIHNLHVKDPEKITMMIAFFSGGFFLGSRPHMPLRWLLHFLSGGVCGYSIARFLLDLSDKKKAPVHEETNPSIKVIEAHPSGDHLENVHVIEAHPEEKHLKNVQIIEPKY